MRKVPIFALALLILDAAIFACDGHDAPVAGDFLIVQVASAQPTATNLGVIVAIQSSVGTLRMRSVGGTMRLTTDDAPRTTDCIPAPSNILYLTVFPDADQALLYVDLLPWVDAAASSNDAALAQACPGDPRLSRVVRVSLPVSNQAADASNVMSDGGTGDSPADALESDALESDASADSPSMGADASDASSDGDATGE